MRPLVFFFLLASPSLVYAVGDVSISIEFGDAGVAHVIIASPVQEGREDLRGLLRESMIREVYRERLSIVFGEIRDLDLCVVDDSVVIEFDASLAVRNDAWRTRGANFSDVLTSPLTLSVRLPENARLIAADPSPTGQTGDVLIWMDVGYLPGLTYDTRPGQSRIILIMAGILALLFGLLRGRMKRHQ